MNIELDRIAIWSPVLVDGINARVRRVQKGENINNEVVDEPYALYRYVKVYDIDNLKFSLFVRTKNSSAKIVEKQLDIVAEEIAKDKEFVLGALATATAKDFTYLDKTLKKENK